MRKLSPFTKAFLSRLPTSPLLPAPPVKLRLAAPATPRMEVIRSRRLTRADIKDAIAQMGPIRSREEMQDEIAALCLDSINILITMRSHRRSHAGQRKIARYAQVACRGSKLTARESWATHPALTPTSH